MNLAWTGMIVAMLIALASGIAMALQGSINSAFAKLIGLLEATFIVHATAAVLTLVLILAIGSEHSNLSDYKQVPWYLYLGGAIGVGITYGVVASIPKLGVAVATTAIIVGQVTTAAIVDYFGLFGLQRIPFGWLKLGGIVLLAAGARLMLVR